MYPRVWFGAIFCKIGEFKMCGIVGFSGNQNTRLLHAMNDYIKHRGPDDSKYYETDAFSMGMRRLSIVDVNSGQQPFVNENQSIVAMFNGEIYDHKSQRKELVQAGHAFTSHHADGEVIVHAYEEYGVEWVKRINGMFAIALWDNSKRELILYRDRLGKKPLYYCEVDNQIIFASEIKALLSNPKVSRELDYAALGRYFSMKNITAPRTAYRAIRQLMPGHMLRWSNGKSKIESFWKADFTPLQDITVEEAAVEVRTLLEDAVGLRMQCDVEFGAYLSGGIDSSAIVAFMSKIHNKPIKTFSLGYTEKDDGQFWGKSQDIQFARSMSKTLGTDHHELFLDAHSFAKAMPSVMKSFNEPFSGTISTYFLSALISQHVKVAISGDGADELFASYLPQRLSFPIQYFSEYKRNGKVRLEQLTNNERMLLKPFDKTEKFFFLANVSAEKNSLWRDKLTVFTMDERSKLLNRDVFPENAYDNLYNDLENDLTAFDILNRNLEIDQKDLLANQILPFVDRLSMAHSVEVRCPFLDYRLVDFVNKLPGTYKINNGINKYVLKKALVDILPEDLINRPKEGFVQPIYSWMHGSLQGWILELLELLPMGLFNRPYVDAIINAYKNGDTRTNAKIWNLACFSLWWLEQKPD